MQGDSLRNDTIAGFALADGTGGQLLVGCTRNGRVSWMSEGVRDRLGSPDNLVNMFGTTQLEAMRRYLRDCQPGGTFTAAIKNRFAHAVPVRLTCLVSSAEGIVLSVEIRERATDHLAAASEDLLSVENRVLQGYFRLLRAQQDLDSRVHRGRRATQPSLSELMERERARLGRQLHSGAGQTFAAIRLQLELVQRLATQLPAEVRGYLDRIETLAQQADAEVRAVSHLLHPPDWQALRLTDALRNLWNNSGIPDRFQGSLTLADLSAEPSQPVRVALYRIAQEGIANAIRHSGATTIAFVLEENDGGLTLRIEDNGKGFDTGQRQAGGIGLRSMRDLADDLGGKLKISSGPEGTKLEVSVPLGLSDDQK